MKGFVPTPHHIVDAMVGQLFRGRPPQERTRLLDPGCGQGVFIEGVIRWCRRKALRPPQIVGIDLDSSRLREARGRLRGEDRVNLASGDFLQKDLGSFDYIIGNPPYVAIDRLSEKERERYRRSYETARGRLDLYLLFWERALKVLRPGGRLVFITPEKYTYVETAGPLRKLLSRLQVERLFFAPEDTFPGLVTYPVITTVVNDPPMGKTTVITRDTRRFQVCFPPGADSWQPVIHVPPRLSGRRTLADVTLRVSCGVATGADKIFLFDAEEITDELRVASVPTLSGRELRYGEPLPEPRRRMVIPYDLDGRLLPEKKLGPLGSYLRRPEVRRRLEARTCTRRKPWYAFHETPPLGDILRPKLLCKDVTLEPVFWPDTEGTIVPRHSLYYIVPLDPALLEPLVKFLNSVEARSWLRAHCHRAANGFLRVQSRALKRIPIPDDLGEFASRRALAL